jgi:hypothetical protein
MSVEPLPVENSENWKKLILVLIILNTVLGAIVGFMQTDAGIRSNQANIESEYYSILASGEILRSSIQSTYDMASYGEVLKNTQESLVLQYTALDEASKGNLAGSQLASLQAAVQQARADQAIRLSLFFSDPRFAPKTPDQAPDIQSYLDEQNSLANSLVSKNNIASDTYHLWSKKADTYVAILTILAVAFFLLGLGQSLTSRVRLLFAVFGMLIMVLGSAWTVLTFFS